jgi:hypothetical protein
MNMSISSYYDGMQNQVSFQSFWREIFPAEHRHPANVALHVFGVLAGFALIGAALTIWPWWAALAFPVVHVAPGLMGHRLFERNEDVGDVRLTRTDFPLYWFLIANHIMAAQVLTGQWRRAGKPSHRL